MPEGASASTTSWQSHSLVSAVMGRPEKCTGTQMAPLRPTIQVATGESKAAREKRHHLAGGAHGKAAHTGCRGGVDEGVALHHVDDHGDVGVVHVDLLLGEGLAEGRATIWFISRL